MPTFLLWICMNVSLEPVCVLRKKETVSGIDFSGRTTLE